VKYLALVVLSGCGRLAFDPLSDPSANDSGVADGMSSSDLVVYMPFDPFLLDEIARGHDASCFGGPCPTRTASPHGMAAVFTGQECLQIPYSPEFRLNDFTATAWVLAGNNPSDADIFSHPLDGATTSQDSFEMFFEPSTTSWQFVLGPIVAGTPADIAGWHHLAATLGSGTLRVYVDGTMHQTIGGLSPVYASDPLFIGCDLDNNVGTAKWSGQIDEVRLYNRALSASEIAALATE
jgi:hypothetical protein